MGNWHISIKGTGCHHNGDKTDVEQLAKKFVEDLKAAGQSVSSADVTTGGAMRLPEDVMPLKEEPPK